MAVTAQPVVVTGVVVPTRPAGIPVDDLEGGWCLVSRCCYCPNACIRASVAKVDDDAFTVNGCVCACIVCCPMCSEYRRSPHDPWRFDEYKCGSRDDRHPWILTSAEPLDPDERRRHARRGLLRGHDVGLLRHEGLEAWRIATDSEITQD